MWKEINILTPIQPDGSCPAVYHEREKLFILECGRKYSHTNPTWRFVSGRLSRERKAVHPGMWKEINILTPIQPDGSCLAIYYEREKLFILECGGKYSHTNPTWSRLHLLYLHRVYEIVTGAMNGFNWTIYCLWDFNSYQVVLLLEREHMFTGYPGHAMFPCRSTDVWWKSAIVNKVVRQVTSNYGIPSEKVLVDCMTR